MKRSLLLIGAALLAAPYVHGQCLNWVQPSPTSGWPDFNNQFGGAPCSENPPLTFEITGFEVWQSEAYAIANVKAGGSYTVGACNGPDNGAPTNSWTKNFTVITPSGVIDAFGRNSGSLCELTFTASEAGNYIIAVNRSGSANCGQFADLDGGFFSLTYNGGALCDPPVTACEAGIIDNSETAAELCPGDFTEFDVLGVIVPNSPTLGGLGIRFDPVPGSGSGGLAGGFSLTGVNPDNLPYSFDNDLNGVLEANSLPPLLGEWSMRPYVYADAAAPLTACDSTAAAATVNFLSSGAAACGELACEAGDVTAGDQTVCPGEDWELTISGEELPVPGSVYWFFLDTNDTSGENDYIFNLGSDPSFYNFTGNFNGLLAAAELDTIIPGTYLTFAGIFNPQDTSICSFTPGDFYTTVLDGDDPACGGVPPCESPYPMVTGKGETFLPNGVMLTWDPIPGSIGCEVQGSRADGVGNRKIRILGELVSERFIPQSILTPGTTYRWRVRCGCSSSVAGPNTEYRFFLWDPSAGMVEVSQNPQDYPMPKGGLLTDGELSAAAAKTQDTPVFRNILNPRELYGNVPREADYKAARSLKNKFDGHAGASAAVDGLDLYPNPSAGSVNMRYAAASEGLISVRIFDAAGRIVKSESIAVHAGDNFNDMDLAGLDEGLYMVEVTEGGKRSVQRIVISK